MTKKYTVHSILEYTKKISSTDLIIIRVVPKLQVTDHTIQLSVNNEIKKHLRLTLRADRCQCSKNRDI